jgi:hypothetical protein
VRTGALKLQGWLKVFKLAQYFDHKSLLIARTWANFWANPVTFTRAGREPRQRGRRGRQAERRPARGPAWTRDFCHSPSPALVCMENP